MFAFVPNILKTSIFYIINAIYLGFAFFAQKHGKPIINFLGFKKIFFSVFKYYLYPTIHNF